MMENINILIVEDEQRLAEILKKQLEESGFKTEIAYDGYTGKQLVEKNKYNLIILDINLPIINGYDLCKEIRKTNSNIPIIMLTAFGTPENKLTGFDAGADDYIVKPFDYRELLARINVFLRRSDSNLYTTEKIGIADLEMDFNTKTVTRSNKKIELTVIEQVWGIDFDPNTNIIDVYVNYLRKKIDKDFKPKLIHTKFGFGFYCSEKEI
jgi:two-component system copper resistance phosphate regulon response regulator CusR